CRGVCGDDDRRNGNAVSRPVATDGRGRHRRRRHGSVMIIILLAAADAVIGDHVWDAVGRQRGQGILDWCCRVTMRSDDIARANALLRRLGPFAIGLGRFVAALRILITAVTAGSGMPYYQYLLGEVAGALVLSSLYVLIGYGAGGYLKALAEPQGGGLVAGI